MSNELPTPPRIRSRSTSAVFPCLASDAAMLQETVVDPQPPIVGTTWISRARLPMPCWLATRSIAAPNLSSATGSGMNSFTPRCIASIRRFASSTWLMRKKLVFGNCRGRCAIFFSDSCAPGSRLTMTTCGASVRDRCAGSVSAVGNCATTLTPKCDRNPAISWRLPLSASTIMLVSCAYMSISVAWASRPCSFAKTHGRGAHATNSHATRRLLVLSCRHLARRRREAVAAAELRRRSGRRRHLLAVRRRAFAAEVAVPEQLRFRRVTPVLARPRRDLVGVHRFDDVRRDEHDQLRLATEVPHGPEQRPDDREVAKHRRHVLARGDVAVQQPRYRERLALVQFDRRGEVALAQARHLRARDADGGGEIEIAHLRRNLQPNAAVAEDDGEELELYAEVAVLDGDRGFTAHSCLRDRHRELAAREELCFLAADRDQVRLGQHAEEIVLP